MFNYECTQRNGKVVGACVDGFLFGACCQLPPGSPTNGNGGLSATEEFLGLHQIDHVPDIPILLNPDGTPVGMSVSPSGEITKPDKTSASNHLNGAETTYTKISSSNQASTSPDVAANNYGSTQTPVQPDISHLAEDFQALLGQQEIIDDLRLPGLLTHSDSNNDIQDHQDPSAVKPITTLLSSDQILQIADPVDHFTALFSQSIGANNHSDPETILLNENGTMLEESYNPDEIFQPVTETSVDKKVTQADGSIPCCLDNAWDTWPQFTKRPTSTTTKLTQGTKSPMTPIMTRMPVVTQMHANVQKITSDSLSTQLGMTNIYEKLNTIEKKVSTRIASNPSSMMLEVTTPMSASSVSDDELVKVPTITYDMPSGNKKKDDVLDKEEIAINHIISILNDTTPNSDISVTLQVPNSSPVQAWVSIDETSKPAHAKITSLSYRPTTPATLSTYPYTFYKPSSLHRPSSTYYNYELVPTPGTETTYASQSTSSSSYASRPSTQATYGASSSFSQSKRPTTNPPAPTVIVLGPLGTGFTTETTQKPVTRKPSGGTKPIKTTPVRPIVVSTKKPIVSTMITHNISTVISNVANNNVVSTSYISVNLKDDVSSARPNIDVSTESIQSVTNTKIRPSTRKPIRTTISSWSDKPTFNLKPSRPNHDWADDQLTPINTIVLKGTTDSVDRDTTRFTTTAPCDSETENPTAAPDDLSNFPPVRNPNFNISAPISQQEKPTIVETYNASYPDIELISESDIPTPAFIEDDVLTNKVDAFVNKIVESLQGNFQVTHTNQSYIVDFKITPTRIVCVFFM